MIGITTLDTEKKNEKSLQIDNLSTMEILKIMNEEDKTIPYAVEKELAHIADASDAIYQKLKNGGRLFYIGCGTSGRIGILDAVECPPTFGTDPTMVQALIAGGEHAFIKAVEGAEDSRELGKADLVAKHFTDEDILVGLAASGRTPYVIGGLEYARELGAVTVSVTCCRNSEIEKISDIPIVLRTGPEVITGSTRLKCGTAQKMVLNMISTSVMIKLGKVYGNLMVDLKATNEKLMSRAISIVESITNESEERVVEALKQCDFSSKTAIVMLRCKITAKEATEKILQADGHIGRIID